MFEKLSISLLNKWYTWLIVISCVVLLIWGFWSLVNDIKLWFEANPVDEWSVTEAIFYGATLIAGVLFLKWLMTGNHPET